MRVLCSLITLALITLALTRTSHADDRKAASAAFAAGEAADKKKDYRAAIEHYLKAYELAPHHFALYNIGIDYERLGEYRQSAEWFNRYIVEAPASAELDRVQKLLLDLKLRPAKLTVTTKPAGARVFIDGQYSGSTPFSKVVRGGSRRVAVELAGQRDERDVVIEYGEPEAPPTFILRTVDPVKGPTGTLEVGGAPEGAQVEVDEQVVGSIPAKIEVTPGPHAIKVSKYGYVPFETTANVSINQTTPVMAYLVQGEAPGVTTPGTTAITIGYMVGLGGGLDISNGEPIGLFDLGVRAGQFDLSVRFGKASGLTSYDFLFRFAFFNVRVSPYVGVGLSYVVETDSSSASAGKGFEGVAGIRWDLARAETGTATLLLEAGLRYHGDIVVSATETRSGLIIPVMASVQYTYGRARK